MIVSVPTVQPNDAVGIKTGKNVDEQKKRSKKEALKAFR